MSWSPKKKPSDCKRLTPDSLSLETVGEAIARGRQFLAEVSQSASLDVQVLLADLMKQSRAWLLAHSDYQLDSDQSILFQESLDRYAAGVPLPYILGWWEFYGRVFELSPAVLIPRPETELVVEQALQVIRTRETTMRIADVGTGSGCIAVSLAVEAPDISVVATDRSLAALQVTQANCRRYAVQDRVHLTQADLLSPFAGRFDLITANLPYIPTADLPDLAVARAEPRQALDGGSDGLDLIRLLLSQLPEYLIPGGVAIFEIGADQGKQVQLIVNQYTQFEVEILPDFSGLDRLLLIRRHT